MEKFFHAVDIIIEKGKKVVTIVRKNEPFKGMLAWPGGHLKEDESVEECAVREAEEEVGLKIKLEEILGVYSKPGRDPRGPTISTVFIARAISGKMKAATDAEKVVLIEPEKIQPEKMAFDHGKILLDYLKWKKKKGTYWSNKQ